MLLFTLGVSGCGDTVNLAKSQGGLPVLVFDAGAIPPPSGPPPSLRCDTSFPIAPCGSAEVFECPAAGSALSTRVDPLDCDLSRGFTGDAGVVHEDCETALAGQSGDGCGTSFVCARHSSVPCCVELASCSPDDAPMMRTRACAQYCPPPATFGSGELDSCSQLAVLAGAGDGQQVLGVSCREGLLCGPAFEDLTKRSFDWADSVRLYTCAAGHIQILTTLPNFPIPMAAAGSRPVK